MTIRVALTLLMAAVTAEAAPIAARSGFEFLTPDLQALQHDDFANPGMLWVERGERLWRQAGQGPACASCHRDAVKSMRGVAARYPSFDSESKRVISLEQRINRCRTQRQKAAAYPHESPELLALTVWVTYHSRGMPVAVNIDGPAAASYAEGRTFFYARRGQLDMACSSCHEQHVGARLRGETISQGQINGFPVYRQLWQALASAHRMFAWCNESVRAQPYAYGSQEYVNLELFVKSRGAALSIEAPAVRK
jgi:L-cysteine S-thiosulfotransferase